MDGFIDIYSKLVISIISFIAPLIVYLLSVFSDGIAITKRRTNEEANQIGQLLLNKMNSVGMDTKMIEKSNKQLKAIESSNKRRINLLTPKRQIFRIFCTLFASLFFVMLYKLINDQSLNIYNSICSKLVLLISIGSFISGILILKQVAWAVIETKLIISEDKSAIPIEVDNNKEVN